MNGQRVGATLGTVGLATCFALMFLDGSAGAAAEEGPEAQRKAGPELILPYHQDVSPALRDITPIIPDWFEMTGEKNEHPVLPLPHHHAMADLQHVMDGARQDPVSGPQLNLSATPGLSFDGLGLPGYTPSGAPPDTNGAAGATQYVQWVNTAFAVYNKTTGALVYGPANGNTLWSGFGDRCATDNSGDPIVMYDKAANRWVMMQFAVGAQPFLQCVAVSQTSDATGAWNRYSYSFGSSFNDYPKGGVWPDGYYVTYNMFNASGTAFLGAKVCAMDRSKMLLGQTATQQCFDTSTTYGGLLPSDLDGATAPPAGSPNYVLAFDDVGLNGLNLWKFHVDWTTPANSSFTGPTKITTTSFTEACNGGTCIPQSGTTQKLDSLADRLMFRLAYRNFGSFESLVVNHSVTSGGVAGVRWYELRNPGGTPSVFQQSTFQPDATYRWMGSIAQDQQGNMMMGYSASSSSLKPGVRVTGRLAGDPANAMQAETTVITGAGAQTVNLSRWGDYSSMTIDPSDDCTFWYTTEYIKANGTFNWSTRIASYKFASCGGAPTPDYSVSANPSSMTLTQGTNGTSTITVSSVNGFNSAVALTASGLPSGVTASFAPASVTPPANGSATSILTLTASATAATGTSNVTVTGTSGSTTRTTSINLTVTAAGALTAVYDSTLKAPKCGGVGVSCDSGASLLLGRDGKGPEPNQPNTINTSCADGTSGTFHSDESNDRLKVATTDSSNFAPGKTVTISATVWAYTTPSSDHLDLYYAANANSPTWTFLTTLTPAAAGAQTLTANYTLPTGTLQAVRAQFRYQGSASSCTAGNYNDRDDLIFAVGAGAPDTTPPTTSITAPANGATVSGTVNVTASASDNVGVTRVEFYIDGGLSGTDTTSPYSFSWNTTGLVNGSSHTIQSKAYDAANNVGSSTTISVTVDNGAVAQTAVYDTTLKAPKCGVVGISCDSGASLLLGRDGKGPEPNQPNTINTSCADGTSGGFHSDESNDRLKVATTDGSALAAGKTVTISATVWAWTTPSSDHLDLYYAANANSPTWTFLTTLTPSAAGAQTLTANYTLPAGTLQAVRAQFRYTGSAGTCTSGGYNDRDDLIFAAQ